MPRFVLGVAWTRRTVSPTTPISTRRTAQTYPDSLFAFLASLVPAHDLAWDCATGNGQAALGLTPHFRKIIATDASPRQIAQAHPHPKVTYLVAPAERTPLPDGLVDLVTVATAFHWLDFPRFYAEVRRVAKPDGILAAWGYKVPSVTPEVDASHSTPGCRGSSSFLVPGDEAGCGELSNDPVPL